MVVESAGYVDVVGDEAFEEFAARSRAELAAPGSSAGYVRSAGWVSGGLFEGGVGAKSLTQRRSDRFL